jgi:hypothetical protein
MREGRGLSPGGAAQCEPIVPPRRGCNKRSHPLPHRLNGGLRCDVPPGLRTIQWDGLQPVWFLIFASSTRKPDRLKPVLLGSRQSNLLCGNPDAADEILETRVGAQGAVVERQYVEIYQKCFVLLVGLLQPSERLFLIAQSIKGERNVKGP